MKLNVNAMGLTWGLFIGFGLLFITWWVILFEGSGNVELPVTYIYRGYSVTPIGSLIGLVWGLIDGYISGVIFAWVYNLILKKLNHKN